ncbi:MAG: CofH family radical SAM protein, partial [Candidatus Binatia bacterium]
MIEREPIDRALASVEPALRRALGRAIEGEELDFEDGLAVATSRGFALGVVAAVADHCRRRDVGDVVTYVVNRNINFTNVCIKHCTFCAFSREFRAEEGYFLPIEEVVRRAREAWDYGATEVCIQAGLPPKMDGSLYVDLCKALKRELPDLHIHAFSPEEVLYGSVRSGMSIPAYVAELKAAGLGTIPGTSAEVLVQEVRDRIAPGRITRDQWIEVITSAHAVGLPTSSTIMYGHIETRRHWIEHLALLRDLQRQTGGFTEFVPLSFI